MTNDLLNLWITRLPDPPNPAPGVPQIIEFDRQPNSNLLIAGHTLREARALALQGLRALAVLGTVGDPAQGWLVIDVPVPNRANPTAIIHRMLRRLYFAAVLHGLAELEPFRDAVQSLRLSYLQTRGSVTTATSDEQTSKLNGEFGVSFDLTNPLSAKLTAEAEVKVAQELSAEMARLDLYEAEDQLLYDLQLLAQLEIYINRYNQVTGRKLPRWEQVRNVFRMLYANVKQKSALTLRPVFVFEVGTPSAVVSLMSFLSEASALAVAQSAQILVLGGVDLAAALAADRALNGPIFRDRFLAFSTTPALAKPAPAVGALYEKLCSDTNHPLAPEVVAVVDQIRSGLGAAPVTQ